MKNTRHKRIHVGMKWVSLIFGIILIPAFLFGFLTYSYFALSQWFDPSHPGRHHLEIIGLTDDKDGIIFKANIGTMEIYMDDAEKIYSFLTQTQP